MVAAARWGGDAFDSARIGPDMVGRWADGLLRGRWHHRDITSEPARRGELVFGMATHYATGIVLTQAFVMLARPATRFGIATAILPLLVMYPSMGYGWCGTRSGEAARIRRIMLIGHAAFGVAIALWVPAVTRYRRARSSAGGFRPPANGTY